MSLMMVWASRRTIAALELAASARRTLEVVYLILSDLLSFTIENYDIVQFERIL